jgi:hypothetical protein
MWDDARQGHRRDHRISFRAPVAFATAAGWVARLAEATTQAGSKTS